MELSLGNEDAHDIIVRRALRQLNVLPSGSLLRLSGGAGALADPVSAAIARLQPPAALLRCAAREGDCA